MRIRVDGEEHQVQLPAKGNAYVHGKAWCCNGDLLPGVEDITEYDKEGNEIIPEPEIDPEMV